MNTSTVPQRVFSSQAYDVKGRATFAIVFVLLGLVGGAMYQWREGSNSIVRGRTLQHATELEIVAQLGIQGPIHDIAIVGAGPGGLTAALFGARAGLDVIVLGSETGLLSETQHLDNFPSYFNGNGPDWLRVTKKQALHFGAKFATPGVLAKEISILDKTIFSLKTTSPQKNEEKIYAWSVIVATGATPRHLGLPNESLLWGQYLHNCAICDGHLYRGKRVLVVGGGDSAIDAAILLARYAKQVFLVHRGTQFSGKNQVAVDVAQKTANIEIIQPYEVQHWELDADKQLIGAKIRNTKDHGQKQVLSIDGSFVMIGATPNTDWLKGVIDLDAEGLVNLVGATQSSVSGIFAVGEVADTVYKQAVTASAAGAQAAIDAERWLRETRGVHNHVNPNAAPYVSEPKKAEREMNEHTTENARVDCDPTKKECISHLIKSHPVVVFSKSWCPYCRKAREALAAAGIPEPFVIDLTDNLKATDIQGTLQAMTGRRTVPNVFIGGNSVGGGDETAALQAKGELVPLLVTAGALSKSTNEKKESCNLAEQSCIEDIIQKYPVVMFSLEWCPECKRTLELLRSIGAKQPHIIDLDDHKENSQEIRYHMLTISGRRSVPNLYIGGVFFGGYKQTSQMHEEGKLIAKLQEVGWQLGDQL